MPRGKRGGLSKASYRGGLPPPYPPTLPIDTPISVAGRGRQGVLIGGTTQRPRDQLRGGLLSAFAPTNGRDEVSPTQTPSAPRRSEEAHRVGASRRAILSRDGRTLTRRRPSRREMRACGASSRKRPRRPGLVQAVADRVNSPRGLLQDRPSLSSVGGFKEDIVFAKINDFAVRACRKARCFTKVTSRSEDGIDPSPSCENNSRQEEAENGQHF